jgi:conjugal transfer mating pair stabilization protein TraG
VYRLFGTDCGGELGEKTQRHGPYRLGVSLTLVSMLVVIRTPVQIIDYSNVAQVYKVDNVPIGLAIPASLTTRGKRPRAMRWFSPCPTVSRTVKPGCYLAVIWSRKVRIFFTEPEITCSPTIQNCVMGDIFLNISTLLRS